MIKKKKISEEDNQIWQKYISDPKDIFDKDINQKTQNSPNRFKFDLHGYSLDSANNKVKEIILSCVEKKYREILLITGKGIHSSNYKDAYVSKDFGKIKYSVQEFIKTDNDISKFITSVSNADLKDGGEGAILLKLKRL